MKKKIILIIGLFFMSFVCLFCNNVFQKDEVKELKVYDVLTEDISIDKSGKQLDKNKHNAPEANNKISNVLAQVSGEIEGKRSIRVLAGLDSCLYNDAKFDIVVKNGEEIYKTFNNKVVTRAYTHVIASGVTYSASEAFGDGYNYLVAFTINNVPEYAWEFTFEVVVSVRKTVEDVYSSSDVGYKVMQDMIDADEGLETLKYDVDVAINNDECSINGLGSYKYGDNVNLLVEEKEGFAFIGWYKDDELVTNEKTLSFIMPKENVTYDVKFAQKTSDTTYEFEGVIYTLSGTQISVTGHTENILSEIKLLSTIDGYDVVKIDDYAFNCCDSITSITIPNSLTSISDHAFSKCSSLISLSIPYGVTNIGDYALQGCISLTSIDIPNSVTSIGNYTFQSCINLGFIKIPNSVTSVGKYIFSGCGSIVIFCEAVSQPSGWDLNWNLTSPVYWGNNIDNIICIDGIQYLIQDNTVTIIKSIGNINVDIPSEVQFNGLEYKVTTIGNNAFAGCTTLESITIPNSVTSIGRSAFYNCTSLASFTIPDSVTSIGNNAFYNCSSLTSITIPDSVKSIGDAAFSRCTSLASIEIPNSVTSIGNYAFSYCTSLASIEIPNNVTSIGNDAFYGCTMLESIEIPNSVTSIGDSAFSHCSSLTSITIPNSVTSIGDYAFYNCSSLTSITIPNSVTSIGNSMFSDCISLTKITIPNSVTSIGELAFSGCKNLISIEIPNSVTNIELLAFYECNSLTIYCEASSQPNGWNLDWNPFSLPVYWLGEWSYDNNGNPVPIN